MEKIKNLYEAFEDWASGLLTVAGLLILFYAVLLRYLFNASTSWQGEIATYLVIWGTLMGASVALRDERHMGMELVYRLLPVKMQRYVDIFSNLVVMMFLSFMLFYGSKLVLERFVSAQESMNGIPLWIPYMIIPLSALMMEARIIVKLIQLFQGKTKESEGGTH